LKLDNNKRLAYLKSKYKKLETNGEDRIEYYTSVKQEYNALVSGVGIRDISNKGKLKLSGKDVSEFLHRISTNDVQKLQNFQYVETLFTNEKGRIIDETTLLKLENDFLLINSAIYREKIKRWLDKYIITENITIHDVYSEYCIFEVIGPQAESFLTLSCGNCLDEIDNVMIKSIRLDDMIVRIIKKSDDHFVILTEHAKYTQLVDTIMDYVSAFDPELIGENAYDLYRIEQCTPVAPNELNDNYNPHEAQLLDIISFNKGCYIGQEVIARLDTYDKVQRELVEIESFTEIDSNGDDILIFDKTNSDVGKVTSLISSKDNKRNIGLAYIRKDALIENNKFIAKVLDNNYDIVVKDKKGQA